MGTNYHNEVLRKARVLERMRMAQGGQAPYISAEDDRHDRDRTARIMSDIKADRQQDSYNQAGKINIDTVVGVDRNRQSYDHSRNGAVRDQTRWGMRREANSMYGLKPKYLHNVWKG